VRLLILPGLHGTDGLYSDFLRALPRWIQPATINYPPNGIFTYDEAFEHTLARLPAGRFAILAESFSGPVALSIARSLPDRVIAVVLVVTFVTNPMRPLLRWARLFAYTHFVRMAPVGAVATLLINGHTPRHAYDLVVNEIEALAPSVIAARLRAAIDCDVRADLAACRAPVLYLKARNDCIVSGRTLRTMKAILPWIESRELDGPHAFLLMRPTESADAVAGFLDRTR
jgi:pimeloyl-[acyl-carrier protein] methyl ester esterase